MKIIVLIAVVSVASFITGILFGRKNKTKVEKTVGDVKAVGTAAQAVGTAVKTVVDDVKKK